MRITETMINNSALYDIQNVMRRYSELNKQLTTGKKIQYPSDDAALALRVSNLNSRKTEVERYLSNINTAKNLNQIYDTSLQELSAIYQRTKELMVRGANDSLSQSDRQAIVEEIKIIKDNFASIANTQYAGKYIFSGKETDKAAVIKDGDSYKINISPEANQNAKVSIGGYDIKYGLTVYDVFSTETGSSMFNILDRAEKSLESGNNQSIDQELGAIEKIEKQNILSLSKIGATSKMLELSENRLSDYSQFNTEFLSKENDVDIAKVLTDLSMQQTVMNSALKTAAKIIPPTLVDFL